jgi:uncharacterized protein YcfL
MVKDVLCIVHYVPYNINNVAIVLKVHYKVYWYT